ncbi:MAG: DNA-binding protein [Thermoplasmata archaeon]|nr:DNA-binding protein [Thermoplasmata archaeon]
MEEESWAEKIKKWLEEGRDSSKELVGLPWEVKEERMGDMNLIVAQHPKVPFPIYVKVGGGFSSLFIDLGIETDAMDVKERMKIYKKLLKVNGQLNLFKVALGGDEENVIAMVDLDLTSLSREEFNDALTALLIGSYSVISSLGLSEEFQKSLMERLKGMVLERMKRGESMKEIEDFLVKKVGMERNEAEEILEEIGKMVDEEEVSAEEKTSHYIS